MIKKITTCLLALTLLLVSSLPCIKTAEAQYYCDTMYSESGSTNVSHSVNIPYDTYTQNDIQLIRLCPNYSYDSSLPNSCAPTAGSIIVGYYDYTCANLIPDFDACFIYNGNYRYRATTLEVQEINIELFNLMGTNTEAPGTSAAQFKNGLKEYVENCGYNITFTKCGNRINIETALTYLNAQQPIALFMNSYYYYTTGGVVDLGDGIGMVGRYSTNGHVAIAFGYREYVVTKDNITNTHKYLIVSFGDGSQGLIPLGNISIFEEAYAINIYS